MKIARSFNRKRARLPVAEAVWGAVLFFALSGCMAVPSFAWSGDDSLSLSRDMRLCLSPCGPSEGRGGVPAVLQPWLNRPESAARASRFAVLLGRGVAAGGASDTDPRVSRLTRFYSAVICAEAAAADIASELLERDPEFFTWEYGVSESLNPVYRGRLSAEIASALRRAPSNPFLRLALEQIGGQRPPAEALRGPVSTDPRSLDCRTEQGVLLFRLGFVKEAARLWADVAVKASEAGDFWKSAEAWVLVVQGCLSTGDLPRARNALKEAESAAESFPLPDLRARVSFTKGVLAVRSGVNSEALASFEAVRRDPLVRDARVKLAACLNAGYIYDETGRFQEAVSVMDEAVDACERSGNRRASATARLNRGTLYDRFRMREHARKDYERASVLADQVDMMDIHITALQNLGILYAREGVWESALKILGEALSLAVRSGRAEEGALIRVNLAETLAKKGDLESASEALREGFRLASPAIDPSLEAVMSLTRVRVSMLRRDFAQASGDLDRLGPVLEGREMFPLYMECQLLRGKLMADLGRHAEADALFRQAWNLFVKMESGCESEMVQIRYIATGRELTEAVLENVQSALIDGCPGDWDEVAFQAMEEYRGRVLSRHLGLVARGAGAKDAGGTRPVSLKDVLGFLKGRRASSIMAFQGEKAVYVLRVGDGDRPAFRRAGTVDDIRALRKRVEASVAGRTLDEVPSLSVDWGQFVLGDEVAPSGVGGVNSRDPGVRGDIFYLPDGDMHSIPLELATPPSAATGSVMLGLSHRVRSLPSWRWLLQSPGAPAVVRTSQLAFTGVADSIPTDKSLGTIPHAREEVEDAARLPLWSASRVVVDMKGWGDARGSASVIGGQSVLHIAGHMLVDDDDPWMSRVFVAGFPGGLPLKGLQETRMAHELVVLSSCESGRGRVFPGEGAVSAARVFLSSGVKGVLTCAWPVQDSAARAFSQYFYEALGEVGGDCHEALRMARLKMHGSPRFHDPIHWAGFVLWGSPGPLAGTGKRVGDARWLLLSCLAAAPLVAVWAGRRRRPAQFRRRLLERRGGPAGLGQTG